MSWDRTRVCLFVCFQFHFFRIFNLFPYRHRIIGLKDIQWEFDKGIIFFVVGGGVGGRFFLFWIFVVIGGGVGVGFFCCCCLVVVVVFWFCCCAVVAVAAVVGFSTPTIFEEWKVQTPRESQAL